MTREGEDDLSDPGAVNAKVQDLQRRVQLIHKKKPDCVISIHQNSYPDAAVKGAQVFYYTDSKEGEKTGALHAGCTGRGARSGESQESQGKQNVLHAEEDRRSAGDLRVRIPLKSGGGSAPEHKGVPEKKVADALCDGVLTYLGEKKNGKEKTQTKTEETAAGAASAYACPAGGLSGIRRI